MIVDEWLGIFGDTSLEDQAGGGQMFIHSQFYL